MMIKPPAFNWQGMQGRRFTLTYEARVYAAERGAILLVKAKGLTNDQIRALALR